MVFKLQKVKKQRDELRKYQRRINNVLERDRLLARKLLQEGKKE
jgi:charged multivesicular body protein 6